jgi:hypothetical protein
MGQLDVVLPVNLQPKARPRFLANGRPYTDEVYRAWIKNTRAILAEWWTRPPLQKGELVCLHITFLGPGRSDLDNLAGAVMDAGLPDPMADPPWHGCWIDDRVTVLNRIDLRWEKRSTDDQSILLSVIWK